MVSLVIRVSQRVKWNKRLSEKLQVREMLLSNIAEKAFAQSLRDLTPPALLRNIYNSIEYELAGTESRKRVETTVNAFVNHEETQNWLGSF